MSRRRNKRGKAIDGVLLLDKPAGITSNKALQKCRYLIDAQKGGHTGALDPLATGLLPLCFGQATKISSYLLANDKTYQVEIILGKTTDTGDADGKVLETKPVELDESKVREAVASFVGEYDQVPPMYSALKVNGQPLYKLARQGIEIERQARRVNAYAIRFISLKGVSLSIELDCSSGFYVRSLSEDIGKVLDCGAHVKTLRRTRIDDIDIANAMTLEEFEGLSTEQARTEVLRPADELLGRFSKITLDEKQAVALSFGQQVDLTDELIAGLSDCIRLYNPQQVFLGLGHIDKQGKLAPKRLFV